MILVKQAGVYVNILNCRLKKHLAEVFKKHGVNLTAEQYLVMDNSLHHPEGQEFSDAIH